MTTENTERIEEKNDTPDLCGRYSDRLWDAENDEEVSAHILSCENCRRESERIAKLKEALCGIYAPDDSLSAKLDSAVEKAPVKKKRFRIPKYFGTAAAAVLIVFVLGISGFFKNSDMFLKDMENRSGAPTLAGVFVADNDGNYYSNEKSDAPCLTEEAEETLPAREPSYSADKVKNSGFNYITVSGITKPELLNALSDKDIALKTDVTVSSQQAAVSDADIEKVKSILKDIGAVIISADSGENALFTLIEIR